VKPRPRASAPPDPESFWGDKAVAERVRASQLDAPAAMLAAIPGPPRTDALAAVSRLRGVNGEAYFIGHVQYLRADTGEVLADWQENRLVRVLPDWRLIGLTDPRPRGT
jgi:hypothetical protein